MDPVSYRDNSVNFDPVQDLPVGETKAPARPSATFPIFDPTKSEDVQKYSMLHKFEERQADPIGSFKGLANTCLVSSTPEPCGFSTGG